MSSANQRKWYFRTNKYQSRIIYSTLIPTVFICIVIYLLISIFQRELTEVLLYQTEAPSIGFINKWVGLIIAALWSLFVLFFLWTFSISKNLLGAFERIIRELDEVIETKTKKKLHARPNDDLANELLTRVNVLIEGNQSFKEE